MLLNTDFSLNVVVRSKDVEWVDSPQSGVFRKPYERMGQERARATSLVRYEAGSSFPTHVHDLGEEIIVLEGSLEDEHGQYSTGTFIKNPPKSSHAPQSKEGCLLFVKLRHMRAEDQKRVVKHLDDDSAWLPGNKEGVSVKPLASFSQEYSAFVRLNPNTEMELQKQKGGHEIFVFEGKLTVGSQRCDQYDWLRTPEASGKFIAGDEGCLIWVKVGHLPLQA